MKPGPLVVAFVLACLVLGWIAASRSLWYETTDFYCLWQGARLTLAGADPYDEPTWLAATGGLHPDPSGELRPTSCPGRYGYPLWTAVLLAPLALVPLPVAATAWAALSFALVAIGAAASWRAAGGMRELLPFFAALVVSAQPLWLLAISGQLTGVMLGLVGLSALWLARGWDRAAGASFALLVLKPQIVALYGPALFIRALRGRPGFAVAAVVTLAALLTVTLAIAPAWLGEWLGEIGGRRLRVTALLPTAWGLSADLFGTIAVAPVLIVAVFVAAAVLVRGRGGLLGLAAWMLPISLFAAPYAWSYDHLVLAFSWAVALATAARSAPPLRLAIVLLVATVASLLPWVLYAIAFTRGGETLNALVPASTALVVAGALGADARARARVAPAVEAARAS